MYCHIQPLDGHAEVGIAARLQVLGRLKSKMHAGSCSIQGLQGQATLPWSV